MRLTDHLAPPTDMETPSGWKEIESPASDVLRKWERDGLYVQAGEENYKEGEVWLRVTCSCYPKVPSEEDVKRVIESFLGAEFVQENPRTFVVQPSDRKMYGPGAAPPIVHILFCKEGEPRPDSFVVNNIKQGMV